MAFWSWSKTAASNSSADGTINWAEGQAPSSVNDSARAMMARTAEWRDDISGTITTGGTSTAYTVTSNQGFDTLAHMGGAMIAFVPHTTSGSPVTLNVDGLGAKPVRSSPSVELQNGVLIQGTPYTVTYNNSDGAFYFRNFLGNNINVPIGSLLPYISGTLPSGSNWALPAGQNISRTTYASLFSLISTFYGIGDGSTTFGLPDLRGRAVFGIDNMGGSAANRITVAGGNWDGTTFGGVGGAQNHTLTTSEMPSHNHTITDLGHSHTISAGGTTNTGGLQGTGAGTVQGNPGTSTNTTGITINNNGSGAAHTIMPPGMTLNYILRVL